MGQAVEQNFTQSDLLLDPVEGTTSNPSLDSDEKIELIRRELLDEYREPHDHPWIVGFSGGKDSTLVLHLVVEMLLSLAPSDRRREVHVVANDTLVESPLVIGHLKRILSRLRDAALGLGIPLIVRKTEPKLDQSFWVNLIGRGYPSPNRTFRWCTDRMKIQPTSIYVRESVQETGQVILLLGVRRAESALRAHSVNRYSNGERLNSHNDLPGCMVFRPIVDLETEEVWEFLAMGKPPWGGSYEELISLYKDANGGECPVVIDPDAAPSCGSTSSRFGCWTCTVVEKDRSMEGFIEAGFNEFEPLMDFRDWLAEIRGNPTLRSAQRRNGKDTYTADGTLIPGPFTLPARAMILDRLLKLQEQVGFELIRDDEISVIRSIWSEDALDRVRRSV